MPRGWFWLDVSVKAALIGLLVLGAAATNLPQFEGKAMAGRAATFWIPAALVPVIWWLWFRQRSYPWALDVLIVLPFLIDAAGNAANLYDTISWWDDANHLVNWCILTLAIGLLLVRLRPRLQPWIVFGLAIGFGAVTAILWELGEYLTFIRGNANELATAYTDTLGDLTLGLAGSALAAAFTAWRAARPSDRG